jgi:hypothetical protein
MERYKDASADRRSIGVDQTDRVRERVDRSREQTDRVRERVDRSREQTDRVRERLDRSKETDRARERRDLSRDLRYCIIRLIRYSKPQSLVIKWFRKCALIDKVHL